MKRYFQSKLVLFFLIFPFFNPTSLQYIQGLKILYSAIQVWELFSICFIIFAYCLSRKFSSIIKIIILFESMLIIFSIINGVTNDKIFTNALLAIGISMLTELCIKENPYRFCKMLANITLALLIINFVICLLFPNGFYIASLYENWTNPMYFLSIDNGMIKSLLPGLVFSFIYDNCFKHARRTYRFFIVSIISFLTLLIVNSVTGILTFIIFEATLLAYTKIKKDKISYKLMVAIYIMFMAIVVIMGIDLGIFSKIFSFMGSSSTFTGRAILWNAAIKSIMNSPLIGYGYTSGNIEVWGGSFSSHNIFLELMLQGGILSFTVFVYLTFYAFRRNHLSNYIYHNIIFLAVFSFLIVGLMETGINSFYFVFVILACYPGFDTTVKTRRMKIKKL